jgi:hypothetical protein
MEHPMTRFPNQVRRRSPWRRVLAVTAGCLVLVNGSSALPVDRQVAAPITGHVRGIAVPGRHATAVGEAGVRTVTGTSPVSGPGRPR